ncbi:MAG: beta-propeller domain-containing protein [Deltaproteobacteria bacterium]|nr:beta-propeller domain-containing protein [Deltaproteobacteria bacterium]
MTTVTNPPQWQCTQEQIAEANDDPFGTAGAGGSAGESVSLHETTCEGLAALRRDALKKSQRDILVLQRWNLLRDKCLPHSQTVYVDSLGNPDPSCAPHYADAGQGGSGGSSSGGSGNEEYSTTNTQVPNVDEADYIKNNGSTVYVLSTDGLHVIDVSAPQDTHQIALLPQPGEPRRLYLSDNRLVVYSYLATTPGESPGVPSSQGCTYGYGCRFTDEGGRTLARVLDVTDPANPVELARYEMSGGYADSRRIGSSIYTVVHDPGVSVVPGLNLTLAATSPADLEALYSSLLAKADAAVDAMSDPYFLPWVRALDANGNLKADITSCDRALAANAAQGGSFVSVVSFDITGATAPSRSIIASKPGFVFASTQALYFATDGVDGGDVISSWSPSASDRSTIHKFHLAGADVAYAGSASIRGHVLNQFSMDEHDGVLRVASTSGWVPDPQVTSTITTLQEQAGGLAVIGELPGLAPEEDIRAVRFDGDRGFVVTFKKTDPLFVIDLANAAQPKVLGELKIPGFSTYLHRLDDNHLLAVGFDADDQGSFAFFDGILVQIFDVTDLANPLLLHKVVIGTRGSGSEALLNHLAFNYFPPKQMLALPMTICEGGGNGTFGDKLTFAGLMVFDVSLASGIAEHGRMPFTDAADATKYSACGSWWTDATSSVKRSIFMGDYAIGISDGEFKVAALSDLDTVLQSIPLGGN